MQSRTQVNLSPRILPSQVFPYTSTFYPHVCMRVHVYVIAMCTILVGKVHVRTRVRSRTQVNLSRTQVNLPSPPPNSLLPSFSLYFNPHVCMRVRNCHVYNTCWEGCTRVNLCLGKESYVIDIVVNVCLPVCVYMCVRV